MRLISIITAFLCMFIMLPINSVNAQTQVFSDVPASYSYYEDIMYLLNKGVIKKSSKYGVSDIVTREEVAVMVAKAIGLDGTPKATQFKDVPKNNPNSGYIQSAYEEGILNGYPDGTFKPNNKVTRGQMAVFIANAFDLPEGTETFKDLKVGQTGYEQIKSLAAVNIASGYLDGTFKPNNQLNRAHISVFLANAISYKVNRSKTQQELKETVYKLFNNSKFMFVNPSSKMVNGIMTQYNGHTYSVQNQVQYDAVMNKVKEMVAEYYAHAEKSNYMNKLADQGSYVWSTGFQAKDRNQNTIGWQLKEYHDRGYSFDEAIRLWQASALGSEVMVNGAENILPIDPRSKGLEDAYQHLFSGITDCDSRAQATQVIYDMMGFATAIYGQINVHADLFVKYDNDYYNGTSGLSLVGSGSNFGTTTGYYTTPWTQQKFTTIK